MRLQTFIGGFVVMALFTVAAFPATVPTAEAAGSRGTSYGFTSGTCFEMTALTGLAGAYTAEVADALDGTSAEQAAANLTVVGEREYQAAFAQELRVYEATCGDEEAELDFPCTGGVNQEGTTWITCEMFGTSCTVVFQRGVEPWGWCSEGPAVS